MQYVHGKMRPTSPPTGCETYVYMELNLLVQFRNHFARKRKPATPSFPFAVDSRPICRELHSASAQCQLIAQAGKGADRNRVPKDLKRKRDVPSSICRTSAGLYPLVPDLPPSTKEGKFPSKPCRLFLTPLESMYVQNFLS